MRKIVLLVVLTLLLCASQARAGVRRPEKSKEAPSQRKMVGVVTRVDQDGRKHCFEEWLKCRNVNIAPKHLKDWPPEIRSKIETSTEMCDDPEEKEVSCKTRMEDGPHAPLLQRGI